MTLAKDFFDIVVIGSGPSGSMAAAYAAQSGCSVALIERNSGPSTPVRCGEGIGSRGLSLSLELDRRWVLADIEKVQMISPSGHIVSLTDIEPSYILSREIFDLDLVKYAQEKGVVYIPNTPIVSVSLNAGVYHCKSLTRQFSAQCVVIADGVESRLARQLGWNTALSPEDLECAAFCRVSDDSIQDNAIELYIGRRYTPGGFVWVFPRGNKQANVGLGVIGTWCKPGLPQQLLHSFVQQRFPHAVTISHEHAGGVPVAPWTRPLVRHGALLVGDAARQVACHSGGGIAYSLFAGKCAGQTLAEAFSHHSFDYKHLMTYQKRWQQSCGKQQQRSYSLKNVIVNMKDEFLDSLALSLIQENPQNLNYLRVFLRTFSKNPLLMLKAFLLFR